MQVPEKQLDENKVKQVRTNIAAHCAAACCWETDIQRVLLPYISSQPHVTSEPRFERLEIARLSLMPSLLLAMRALCTNAVLRTGNGSLGKVTESR